MPAEDPVTADLIRRLGATDAPLPLVQALAQEFATGRFPDPELALNGLRAALAAAAETAALAGENETLRQVAALNAAGDRAAAAALLDGATEEPLLAAAARQDRICNAPEQAAARQIERLKAAAPAGGVFRATVDLLYEKLAAGEKAGDPFDMLLALELAKALYKRAKGGELGQAQTSLGNCHQIIGQFRPGRKHLDLAAELFTAAAKAVARTKQPENWAFSQHNLGGIHELIGLRHRDAAMLKKAIKAYSAVLEVFNSQGSPLEWANSTAARANVRAALGRMTGDAALIETAIADLDAVLEALKQEDHPADWASAVATLALARRHLAEVTGDATPLRTAIEEFEAADAVLAGLETPAERARLQHNLGLTALALARALPASDGAARAQQAFETALACGRRDHADYRWAESLTGLARVALIRGDQAEADRLLAEARAVLALDPASAALKDCEDLRA
ncbi:hypothetical protein C8J30_10734 [Rhodobacter viridis]|uniref:Tetratricopeptide repeat protein n=1 Tax=Rhodobacter viridis TaxID=1054202 RepID=A0A318UBS0_9RHOB|nr:hypothetical protein [Rhodobacter viridis]PYF09664.1 hypothetical protein C8J30_10734 [Rhodobacter viridis]